MALPDPGENYWLPPEIGSHDKDTPRPHVVVSPSAQNDTVVTLCFGSTSGLQALHFFAPHTLVAKNSSTFAMTGLSESTYFYPSRLAVCLLGELPRHAAGRIVDEFPDLRDNELPRAVGIVRHPAPERRASIARFTDDFADLIGAKHGIVVTWPPYSVRDQVQNVVPICDGEEFEEVAPNFAVREKSWLDQLGLKTALVMIQLVQGAHDGGDHLPPEDRDIESYLSERVDPDTMRMVDEALAFRLFGAKLDFVQAGHR